MIHFDGEGALKKEDCTGCGACLNLCPVDAVSMRTDPEGFWYPAVDGQKCVRCARCRAVCPVLSGSAPSPDGGEEPCGKPARIYAAWSLDPDIRYHSTSGGIFSELALRILEDGGYVCGAVYDARHMVCHRVTDREEDLEKLRQSKYVQSDMGRVYGEIAEILAQGKKLLFCGTPCQCAGVSRYCTEKGADTGGLYLADFICRGSNSPKVYRKFLDEMESRYQAAVGRVWFKNKAYGWNRFSTRIEFADGGCYLEDRYHDVYIRGYIEANLFIRPSCASCGFKGFRRVSDLTLGDFWGVQLTSRQDADGGTSMVMVHTEKGERLWERIAGRVYREEKSLEEVVPGNSCFYHPVEQGVHREAFMRDLDSMPVIDNIARFLS